MQVSIVPRVVYCPIKTYQTSIIQLHGGLGDPDSPVICDLHTAAILHTAFEGFLVHAGGWQSETNQEYDALSYTWGRGPTDHRIICNGMPLPIRENLSDASRTLRDTQDRSLFLWIDAVCINQSNDEEKSEQVWNMHMIFKKARRVIAWLGQAHEDAEKVVTVAQALWVNPCDIRSTPHKDILLRGIEHIYTRPWFRRLWIQQEVQAARNLVFNFGSVSFSWPELLSQPKQLLRTRFPIGSEIDEARKNEEVIAGIRTQASDAAPIEDYVITELQRLCTMNLTCFLQFLNHQPLNFIETLLHTSQLGATNPRDYVYGILGLADAPAKSMDWRTWKGDRRNETIIPIDYSMDIVSLLCVVSRILIVKYGLGALVKFKAFAVEDDDASEYTTPSWVIDWSLSGRLFRRIDQDPDKTKWTFLWELSGDISPLRRLRDCGSQISTRP